MGEWSKKIGEYGEDIVETFFSVIGWNDLTKGVQLPCINKYHLNKKEKPKETHGIDFLFSYINPLVSGQLNNIVISSKFKTEKYPNTPTSLFKDFMDDLITTIECFEYSEIKDSIVSNCNCTSVNDIGVLFWLNNQEDSNDDLISVVSSVRMSDYHMNKTFYIMDNKRVAFLLNVIKYVKAQSDKFNYSFYYPNTGLNINPQNRENKGDILPVEYLNSTLIPISLVNKYNSRETELFLATSDNFDEADLIRLIGLAKDITTELIGQVTIAFPDYNKLDHSNLVSTAKHKFQSSEFTKTVKVINYNNLLNVF